MKLLLILIGVTLMSCSTTSDYKPMNGSRNDYNLIKQKSNMEYVLRSYRV